MDRFNGGKWKEFERLILLIYDIRTVCSHSCLLLVQQHPSSLFYIVRPPHHHHQKKRKQLLALYSERFRIPAGRQILIAFQRRGYIQISTERECPGAAQYFIQSFIQNMKLYIIYKNFFYLLPSFFFFFCLKCKTKVHTQRDMVANFLGGKG